MLRRSTIKGSSVFFKLQIFVFLLKFGSPAESSAGFSVFQDVNVPILRPKDCISPEIDRPFAV